MVRPLLGVEEDRPLEPSPAMDRTRPASPDGEDVVGLWATESVPRAGAAAPPTPGTARSPARSRVAAALGHKRSQPSRRTNGWSGWRRRRGRSRRRGSPRSTRLGGAAAVVSSRSLQEVELLATPHRGRGRAPTPPWAPLDLDPRLPRTLGDVDVLAAGAGSPPASAWWSGGTWPTRRIALGDLVGGAQVGPRHGLDERHPQPVGAPGR